MPTFPTSWARPSSVSVAKPLVTWTGGRNACKPLSENSNWSAPTITALVVAPASVPLIELNKNLLRRILSDFQHACKKLFLTRPKDVSNLPDAISYASARPGPVRRDWRTPMIAAM